MLSNQIALIVIGASYGGVEAYRYLIPKLTNLIDQPIVAVQHASATSGSGFAECLDELSSSKVVEASHGLKILPRTVYFSPGDYHLLVERVGSLSLSKDDPVNYARPSIDVLFDSAAESYGSALLALLLTGANNDGAEGVVAVKSHGGVAIVEKPATAKCPIMPSSALSQCKVDYVEELSNIPRLVQSIINHV